MSSYRTYEWPDGIFVELIVRGAHSDTWGGIFSIKRPLSESQSVPLFTMELVASALRAAGMPPLMIAFNSRIQNAPINQAFLPKLLGFLLDLGAAKYPTSIPRRSLIPKDRPGQKEDYAPYPRFVSDIRWEGRYEEAQRFVGAVARNEKYLGLLRNFEVLPPEFYLDDTWHASYSDMSKDEMVSLYFHALIDKVLDEELILPESSKTAWEGANVERGVFVLPSPEEVEIFSILDEQLPLLLPMKQLEDWIRSRE